ncbi:MAG: hypothetical protein IT450_11015 [Phycisphaerales bacterium]|nr:hypothetical protein [Phycisphaerales bacterium]
MRRLTVILNVSLAAAAAAQHADIVVGAAPQGLETRDSLTGAPARVFEGELGELSIPGWTNNPGYNGSTLTAAERIGFNIVGPLLYWDGAAYVAPPNGERLDISLNGTTVATARGDTVLEPGVVFAIATGSGSIHSHLGYWVKHPDFDPADPFTNPIAGPGAYALLLELTSDLRDAAPPFYVVFNNGLDPAAHEAALAAAEDRLDPPLCPGDLNGDGAVGIGDLSQLLSHFGTTAGAAAGDGDLDGDGDVDISDLALLLGVFGTRCP